MQQRLPILTRDTSCEVSNFALRTLGVLARDMRPVADARPPLESYLRQMQAAVLDTDRTVLEDLIAQMRKALVPAAEIAESYVPVVARHLGACWVEDTLDFRMVSIGSARLQSLLWQLEENEDDAPMRTTPSGARLLIGVPQGCQHTLGATVLVGQLRRMGLGVTFELELTPAKLGKMMAIQGFAGVLISASTKENLAVLKNLVQTARQIQATTPVCIGGNVTEQMADVEQITGADLVTCDVDMVLARCGLSPAQNADALQDAG